MAVPNGDHEVGGLKLRKQEDRWPFLVLEDYPHGWKVAPRLGSEYVPVINDKNGNPVVRFRNDVSVTLLQGYGWDGNSAPSFVAPDTLKCLRASALHDAWCQAMRRRILERSFRNWRRGCIEYRKVCRDDGMGIPRAWIRYFPMCWFYGTWKKLREN